jgi:hypothetical protein
LWAGGFFCNLDILYGGLGIGKLQFLIKKKIKKIFQLLIFFNFWSLKPWIRIGSGSGSVLASIRILWIRIRIRKKWIRIRNPAKKQAPDPKASGTDPRIRIRTKMSQIYNTATHPQKTDFWIFSQRGNFSTVNPPSVSDISTMAMPNTKFLF